MNFTDAVQALVNGRCKIIQSKYYSLLLDGEGVLTVVGGNRFVPQTTPILYDWQLGGEMPQYIEEKVVRWMCTYCGSMYRKVEIVSEGCCVGEEIIELHGTHKVKIKPKSKRREEITPTEWYWCNLPAAGPEPDGAKFYVEWEE